MFTHIQTSFLGTPLVPFTLQSSCRGAVRVADAQLSRRELLELCSVADAASERVMGTTQGTPTRTPNVYSSFSLAHV